MAGIEGGGIGSFTGCKESSGSCQRAGGEAKHVIVMAG